ncbi:ribosome hibernation-promoting factor, HPF/YfiA family [Pontiella sulfatireligans]|uniref:Ribosome hibernation promoting factor n=1 Tax=Pontiella sulfatireligans TaxID=2750658 RepID=A0A6C2UTX4_9BACT|nr:ribosome-associated translation inhibitor RaiA [Pontiella sulfatireligans]VGO23413.1 Ribosome hibernation promoting factor [Pontiella sulfatireligans]
MQVNITGRNVTATDNVKAHVNDKLERCLGVFPRIESVHVILDAENRDRTSEVIIQGSDHIRLTAKEKSENLFDAIDRSIEHAERQMRKQRDKIQEHHK